MDEQLYFFRLWLLRRGDELRDYLRLYIFDWKHVYLPDKFALNALIAMGED